MAVSGIKSMGGHIHYRNGEDIHWISWGNIGLSMLPVVIKAFYIIGYILFRESTQYLSPIIPDGTKIITTQQKTIIRIYNKSNHLLSDPLLLHQMLHPVQNCTVIGHATRSFHYVMLYTSLGKISRGFMGGVTAVAVLSTTKTRNTNRITVIGVLPWWKKFWLNILSWTRMLLCLHHCRSKQSMMPIHWYRANRHKR